MAIKPQQTYNFDLITHEFIKFELFINNYCTQFSKQYS